MLNKRKTLTATILLTLLISALAGSLFANLAAANPGLLFTPAGPPPTPIVKVIGLDTDKLTLTFSVQKAGSWITRLGNEWGYVISSEVFVDGKLWSQHGESTKPISVSLEGLSNGWHTLEVTATAYGDYSGSKGFSGVIEFQVDNPPPSVSLLSLKNTAVSEGDFQFALRVVGCPLSWVGYSLDGKEKVTVNQGSLTSYVKSWTGNLTLTGLSNGSRSLVVYAKDQTGNTGASATEEFTVAKETQAASFPTTWIASSIVASVAAISFGLVAYFVRVKRKRSET